MSVAAEDLKTVESDPVLKNEFIRKAGNCSIFIEFNTKRPPFDNIKVRQAFAKAFDRDDFIQNVAGGVGHPAYRFIPPGRPGYKPDLKP